MYTIKVYLNPTYIFLLNNHIAKFGVRAATAQLYPDRDTFEFDQGHVTKNQPITVLVLFSESLDISVR